METEDEMTIADRCHGKVEGLDLLKGVKHDFI